MERAKKYAWWGVQVVGVMVLLKVLYSGMFVKPPNYDPPATAGGPAPTIPLLSETIQRKSSDGSVAGGPDRADDSRALSTHQEDLTPR